jgi:hypothetical protein
VDVADDEAVNDVDTMEPDDIVGEVVIMLEDVVEEGLVLLVTDDEAVNDVDTVEPDDVVAVAETEPDEAKVVEVEGN